MGRDAFGPPDGRSGPNADAWGECFKQIRRIEQLHQDHDDLETPRLPDGVAQGARRLIRLLEDQGFAPPSCVTGTADATISFEWHQPAGGERFVSIDVLDIDRYEVFTRYLDRPSTLKTVTL